jgi:hypothetical protein
MHAAQRSAAQSSTGVSSLVNTQPSRHVSDLPPALCCSTAGRCCFLEHAMPHGARCVPVGCV